MPDELVSVRYMVDDVEAAVAFYTTHLPSNRPLFVGACTALLGAESWIESVRIEGLDATGHARWYRGDDACQTQGL